MRGIFSHQHDDIPPCQFRLVPPKTFTNESLDTVSSDSAFNHFARDSQAQSCSLLLRIVPENREICIARTTIVLKNSLELCWPNQSLAAAKAITSTDWNVPVNGRLDA